MTPEEYEIEVQNLRKQIVELGKKFIKSTPLKKLKGKVVNLTIGKSCPQKVLIDDITMDKDYDGRPISPCIFYYPLRKDGKPFKNIECLPISYYKKLSPIEREGANLKKTNARKRKQI